MGIEIQLWGGVSGVSLRFRQRDMKLPTCCENGAEHKPVPTLSAHDGVQSTGPHASHHGRSAARANRRRSSRGSLQRPPTSGLAQPPPPARPAGRGPALYMAYPADQGCRSGTRNNTPRGGGTFSQLALPGSFSAGRPTSLGDLFGRPEHQLTRGAARFSAPPADFRLWGKGGIVSVAHPTIDIPPAVCLSPPTLGPAANLMNNPG